MFNGYHTVVESAKHPVSIDKHQISSLLSLENEQADAGRNGRNCLARAKSQARTGTGIFSFSLFS